MHLITYLEYSQVTIIINKNTFRKATTTDIIKTTILIIHVQSKTLFAVISKTI
jgi:hypothetical protein